MGNKKTYVLDTSVLVTSPYSIFTFEDNDVVLADVVIEELNRLKDSGFEGEKRANAREALRILDELRCHGSLVQGVKLFEGSGMLCVEMNHYDVSLPKMWDANLADNRFLKVCKGLSSDGKEPILVSNDLNLRIKGDLLGLKVEEYKTDQVEEPGSQYTGHTSLYTPPDVIDGIYRKGKIDFAALHGRTFTDDTGAHKWSPDELVRNQFVMLQDYTTPGHKGFGRVDDGVICKLDHFAEKPYGITPKGVLQRLANECLMAPFERAPLVILKGPAGTAKTFLSLACGLENILERRTYSRMLVTRPNAEFDKGIGYLKGDEQDKIGPLMRPVMDNLEQLTISKESGTSYVDELFERKLIVMQAMAFMRGRSIADTWIIIDEAQNMSPKQAFGIISRAGLNSKIILTGDPDQIDNPFLDRRSNGLSFTSERMKGHPLCWQLTFGEEDCVRSELAKAAVQCLSTKGYDTLEKAIKRRL